MADSAIQLTTVLPYELLYKIMRHLNPDELDQLRRVNKRLWSMVWHMRPGEQIFWQPMRLVELPNYESRQIVARNAIAFQPDEQTVRDLTREAFIRGNFNIVRYHFIHDRQYFPEGIELSARFPHDVFLFISAVMHISVDNWVQLDVAGMRNLYHSAIYEAIAWARVTQTSFSAMDALNALFIAALPREDLRASRIRLVTLLLQDMRSDTTPRVLLRFMQRVSDRNTDLIELLQQYQRRLYPDRVYSLDDRRTSHLVAIQAFRSGDLQTLQHQLRYNSEYFPLDDGHRQIGVVTDLFEFMQAAIVFGKWVQCNEFILSHVMGTIAMEYYEVIEWARNTQMAFDAVDAINRLARARFGWHDHPVMTDDELRVYRRQLFERLVQELENVDNLAQHADTDNTVFMEIVIVELMRRKRSTSTIESALTTLLYAGRPNEYQGILSWVYCHYHYSIPGKRWAKLKPLVEGLRRGTMISWANGFYRLELLLSVDRSCLAELVSMADPPKELFVLWQFNDIAVEETLLEEQSLKTLKCYKNASVSPRRLACTIDQCETAVILDDLDKAIDMLPLYPGSLQELCNLALQMSSLEVAAYLFDEHDLYPDEPTILWVARYGTVDAMKFIAPSTYDSTYLSRAIETGNVKMALYLWQEVGIALPPIPLITTVRMAEALNRLPPIMDVFREGNVALLKVMKPDSSLFLDAVAFGNGKVVKWFIDNYDTLPMEQARDVARQNAMFFLHDWLLHHIV